jgi:hypothetical protein
MGKLIYQEKLSDVGRKKDSAKICEKPPYAVAQRSGHIPDDDPKPRVSVAYKKVPPQFYYNRKRRITEFR